MLLNVLILIPICFFTYSLNYGLHKYLNDNKLYKNYNKDRKRYITKNLIKSIILLIISLVTIKPIYNIIKYDYWNNDMIHIIGSLYVSNDILGVLLINNLPTSTKFHHLVSIILLFLNYNIDYGASNKSKHIDIGILLLVYVCFSSYAFLVNFTLGYRFLVGKENTKVITLLKQISYYKYLLSCLVNWTIQLILLYNFSSISLLVKSVYVLIMIPIINDDIVLMKWLKN